MIHVDKAENKTVASCDVCGAQEVSDVANGVIPLDWMTGQLWLDLSLAEQKQTAICFCPECKPHIASSLRMIIAK